MIHEDIRNNTEQHTPNFMSSLRAISYVFVAVTVSLVPTARVSIYCLLKE